MDINERINKFCQDQERWHHERLEAINRQHRFMNIMIWACFAAVVFSPFVAMFFKN